jgi:hypothetical protein
MVSKWAHFWEKYRSILTQDIIHVRRPDMQGIDSIMHVTANRSANVCALAMFYNPSLFEQTTRLRLPLYYTGEVSAVQLEWGGSTTTKMSELPIVHLARDYSISVNVTLGPRGITYAVIHRGSNAPSRGDQNWG